MTMNFYFFIATETGEQNESPDGENTFQSPTLISVSGEESASNPVMSYFSVLPSHLLFNHLFLPFPQFV